MKLQFSQSGPICRGYNASEDFAVSKTARSAYVTGGTTTTETIKDASVNTVTSATFDSVEDIQASLPLSANSATLTSLTPGIATVNSSGSVTRVADGRANIQVSVGRLGKRVIASNVARVTTSSSSLINFISGSLGKHLIDSIATKLSGKTAPTFNGTGGASTTLCDIYSGTGVRNTSAWFNGVDLTCIARYGTFGGEAFTPLHITMASHVVNGQIGASGTVIFDDNSGNSYSRTATTIARIGTSDLMIAQLNTALPSAITPAKLLPSSWLTYLPHSEYGYPCVFTNQDRRLLIADTTNAASNLVVKQSGDSTRSPWFYFIRSGDSGSPCGMIINGNYVHLTNWYGYSGNGQLGPFDTAYINQINSAISGSGYSVSTVDLSGFNTYS